VSQFIHKRQGFIRNGGFMCRARVLFQVWVEIEVELRSSVAIHVYRESHIPNRHGHCNSNPYIPNELRVKLGMPLLDVAAKKAPRLRTALTR
jgi:hypothetical protein